MYVCGFTSSEVQAAEPPADDRRRVPAPPLAAPAGPIGQAVQHHPADVVAGLPVLLAGVPEPDHDLVDLDLLTAVPARRRGQPNGPGTVSGGSRNSIRVDPGSNVARLSRGGAAPARASPPLRRAPRGPCHTGGACRGSRAVAAHPPADHRTSPVWPPRPSPACSTARSTEIAMSPMCVASSSWHLCGRGHRRRRAQDDAGSQHRERQDVGGALMAHVLGVEVRELLVVREHDRDRAGRRSAGGIERAARPLERRRPRTAAA